MGEVDLGQMSHEQFEVELDRRIARARAAADHMLEAWRQPPRQRTVGFVEPSAPGSPGRSGGEAGSDAGDGSIPGISGLVHAEQAEAELREAWQEKMQRLSSARAARS